MYLQQCRGITKAQSLTLRPCFASRSTSLKGRRYLLNNSSSQVNRRWLQGCPPSLTTVSVSEGIFTLYMLVWPIFLHILFVSLLLSLKKQILTNSHCISLTNNYKNPVSFWGLCGGELGPPPLEDTENVDPQEAARAHIHYTHLKEIGPLYGIMGLSHETEI